LKYKANKELTGIYKFFVSMVSPHHIIKRASNVWKQMYNQGEASVEVIDDKNVNLKIVNAPDMPKYHEIAIITYVEEAMRISGCKNPRGILKKSIHNHDDCCLIRFNWE